MAHCERCFMRRYAERKPESWLARLWRWHTGWCQGWKAYQAELKTKEQAPEQSKPESPK